MAEKIIWPKNLCHFINGKWVKSSKTFTLKNPVDESTLCEVYEGGKEEVDLAVEAANSAFDSWASMAPSQRQKLLLKVADLFDRDAKNLSKLESLVNGTPLALQEAVIRALSNEWRYFAGFIDKLDGRVIKNDSCNHFYTTYEPIGVCGIIIPWNLPLWALVVKLAPCLAMGNCCVVKPSEKTPVTALKVAELLQEAGIPSGVVNIVNGFGSTVGTPIAMHPKIHKIAFTGSTATGRHILECCAKSRFLKRCQLELGGKSPVVVMDDADIDEAVQIALFALFSNNGQLCTAGSRTFVHEKIYEKFLEKAKESVKKLTIGDPLDKRNAVGPIVDKIQFERVMNYIEIGKKEGAILEVGGHRYGNLGYFIEPTIFSGVSDKMRVCQEEIFGPVMSVIKFSTLDEAIKRANDNEYGLTSCIVSKDIGNIFNFSRKIQSGSVWVNSYHQVATNAEFGGVKMSGFGPGEGGVEGVKGWTNVKTVVIKVDNKSSL